MKYLDAKSDLAFIQKFKTDVEKLWALEDSGREGNDTSTLPRRTARSVERSYAQRAEEYEPARDEVSKGLLRATRLAHRLGVPVVITSYPAMAVGGPVIDQELFQAVLFDASHGGVPRTNIRDALVQTEGACGERLERERRYLRNPLNWIKEGITFILRLPFLLVKTTGFDVAKIEDHLWGKLFKLLFLIALGYFVLKVGLGKTDLFDLLTSALGK